jgi:hypothetical protein
LTGIYRDLKDLIALLHNYQIPTYVPLNAPILPYNLNSLLPGAVWGNITGTITNQIDLINYINSQISSQTASYTTTIGDGVNTSFTITHNLGSVDVMVEVYENVIFGPTAFDKVNADVLVNSTNTVVVSFGVVPTVGQFKVIVKK